jgi:hypothetical protein
MLDSSKPVTREFGSIVNLRRKIFKYFDIQEDDGNRGIRMPESKSRSNIPDTYIGFAILLAIAGLAQIYDSWIGHAFKLC